MHIHTDINIYIYTNHYIYIYKMFNIVIIPKNFITRNNKKNNKFK